MKRWWYVWLVSSLLVAGAAVVLVWPYLTGSHSSPRGLQWDKPEGIRAELAKEREWADQPFTPIEDSKAFLAAIRGIKVRLDARLTPEAVENLRRILFDQLVCRHSGDLSCYEARFAESRRNELDPEARRWAAVMYHAKLGRELPDNWDAQDVFEELWRAEYDDDTGRRFESVALGPQGALIAIGTVDGTEPAPLDVLPPVLLFTKEELQRWWSWPGAGKRGSAALHPGPHSLQAIVEKEGECVYASVVLIIRNADGEVWCWSPHWYLDPVDHTWQLHGSVIITRRTGYVVPM